MWKTETLPVPHRDRDDGQLALDRLQRPHPARRHAGGARATSTSPPRSTVPAPFRRFFSITLPSIRPTMIFVIITATIGGLQIFTEPKLFNPSSAMPGGPQRQYQTTVLYLWDMAFNRGNFGRASAIAWMLFLIIVVFGLLNFLISRRIASTETQGQQATNGRRSSRSISSDHTPPPARAHSPPQPRRKDMTRSPHQLATHRDPRSREPASRAPKRAALGIDRRPGFLTYGLLLAVFIGGAYPLCWSFVIGSSDQHACSPATWPPLLPGGQFWQNVGAGARHRPVLAGARQQRSSSRR